MNRRAIALIVPLVWLRGEFALAAGASMAIYPAPKPAPALNFSDGDGKVRSLANFKGKVVLLNIWATWCVPCRKEMPTLDRLQSTLGGPDFDVVTLSIDRKGMDAVNQFYAEIGIKHLGRYLAPSASEAMDALGVFGVPATFLIDAQGRIIARKDGPAEWDSPEFVAFFKETIAKSKEANP